MSPLLYAALFLAGAWIALVLLLFALKPATAGELARFVPDCLRLVGRIAKDPATTTSTRLILAACGLYLALPIDLIPDFFPVIGQLDDVVVVALAMRIIVRRSGRPLVRELWPGSEPGLRAVLSLA